MQTFLQSFSLVAVSEMGDKTQLLALLLVARFRKPLTILLAIFLATLLNHAFAAYAGTYISALFAPEILRWILAGLFFLFSAWMLFPDKEETPKKSRYGAFLTTLVLFFLAEIGDKTQLATVALAAKFQDIWLVTLGTTLGMMFANGIAVIFGDKILKQISMIWIHRFAAILFALCGVAILLGF